MAKAELIKKIKEASKNMFHYNGLQSTLNIEYSALKKSRAKMVHNINSKVVNMSNEEREALKEKLQKAEERMAYIEEAKLGAEIQEKRSLEQLMVLYNALFEHFGACFTHGEMVRLLNKRTGKRWSISPINSYDGRTLGFLFIREDDPEFNASAVITDISIVEDRVLIENSNTRKVMYAEVAGYPEYVLQDWDWLKYYVYSLSSFYVYETVDIGLIYEQFMERDTDFAEFITSIIDEEVLKDPAEELFELIEQEGQSE